MGNSRLSESKRNRRRRFMFCPKCGSKIGDDARFCTECGLPLGGLSGKTAAEEGPKAEPSERESSSAEVIMEPTDTETDSAIGSANAESTAEPSPEPVSKTANSGHSQMYNFFMQRCQVGNRLVPQFATRTSSSPISSSNPCNRSKRPKGPRRTRERSKKLSIRWRQSH